MRRLRTLSEAECYVRCYGGWDPTVTVTRVEPRRPRYELAVEIVPEPEPAGLADLLALAERDCFVGSSLTAKPSYRWVVNGRTIAS